MKKSSQNLHKSYKGFYIISIIISIAAIIGAYFIFNFSITHTYLFEKLYDKFMDKQTLISLDEEDTHSTQTSEVTSHTTILEESETATDEYMTNSLFIGDDTLVQFNELNVLPNSKKYITETVDLDMFENGLYDINGSTSLSVEDIITTNNPENVYIMFSGNSLKNFDSSTFYLAISTLVDEIESVKKDINIVIVPILPVSDQFNNTYIPVDVTTEGVNNQLLDIATKSTNYYLDAFNSPLNESGHLHPQYDSGNGVTLNEEGVNVFINYLKTHIVTE